MEVEEVIEFDLEDETYVKHYTINPIHKSISYNASSVRISSARIWFTKVSNLLKSIFLPRGFPCSVREEYLEYQLWDTAQGLCSYLRGIITTKAVLVGVGVGNPSASPFLAAIAWVLKDGMGMIGSLTLAYYASSSFEAYTKEWRLLADVLNNIGLTFDLLCSLAPELSQWFLVASSISKASCGLVAGATKARISAHFAREGHLADVNAKESTQEIAVALLGMILGVMFAKFIGDDDLSIWGWFLMLSAVHMYCNYRLTKMLVFDTLNPQRIYLLTSLLSDAKKQPSPAEYEFSPSKIASRESLVIPVYLAIVGPKLGGSLQEVEQANKLFGIISYWKPETFVVGYTAYKRVCVCLYETCTEKDIIKASFLANFIHINLQGREQWEEVFLSVCDEAKSWYEKMGLTLINSPWNIQSASCLVISSRRLKVNQALKKQQ